MQDYNQDLIRSLAKSISDLKEKKVDPLLLREQELLMQIAKISNNETAHKAKEEFHSQKNVYDFNEYLYWLSKLVELFSLGIPQDTAFDLVWQAIIKRYQEPFSILNY